MPVGRELDGGPRTFIPSPAFVVEAYICNLSVRVQCHGFGIVHLCQFDDPVVLCEKKETDEGRAEDPTHQRPPGS